MRDIRFGLDIKFFILALFSCLLVIPELGCATNQRISQTLESDSILAIRKGPSGTELPLSRGQTITVYSNNRTYWKMVVTDVNNTRIQGRLGAEVVEINFENIEQIDIWSKKTQVDEDALAYYMGSILGIAFAIWIGGVL